MKINIIKRSSFIFIFSKNNNHLHEITFGLGISLSSKDVDTQSVIVIISKLNTTQYTNMEHHPLRINIITEVIVSATNFLTISLRVGLSILVF